MRSKFSTINNTISFPQPFYEGKMKVLIPIFIFKLLYFKKKQKKKLTYYQKNTTSKKMTNCYAHVVKVRETRGPIVP